MKLSDLVSIHESLELAAERVDDLVPLVYERFFALRPDARELFGNDALGRGRMFNETLTMILECTQKVGYLEGIVEREVGDHRGYGATLSMYESYFEAVVQALQAALGEFWLPRHEESWRRQLKHLMSIVARYSQIADEPLNC
jgi:hemoglobin-like flavoprotein